MTFSFIASLLLFFSCAKESNTGPEAIYPTNLHVTADVSTDNSGNVTFTATATNAVSYVFDFGNGVFQTAANGKVTYKYPTSGNYTVTVTGKSATGHTISQSLAVAVTVALTLVWSDEFNTDGTPDPAKWGYDIGGNGWGNNELEYYTNRAENASVSNGTLKITARKESFSGSPYTSARLLTKNKFNTKYGKVEARIKLPAGAGTWPAFWMLGSNIDAVGWPACGEIDIMEHKGSDENRIYGTLHYPGRSGGNANGTTMVIQNATTAFHIYTLEWTASNITISVDGSAYYTFNNHNATPFNQNFFLLLNLAMGGSFAGPVDPAFTTATMEVDYVRVYN